MRHLTVRSCLPLAAFLVTAASPARGQLIEFRRLTEGVLEERLRLVDKDPETRFQRLRSLFLETGCKDLREQKVPTSKQPNLICTITGTTTRKIIVGAHFDSAGGDGVIDNWTGAILLPSLADFIRSKPRTHTFEFVGFAAEEKGLLGSKAYLKSIEKNSRKEISAVVTMDSLGLTPTKVWPNSSDPILMRLATHLAKAFQLELLGVNVDAVGTTDSKTFHDVKIPVLSLHSVTQETLGSINSPKDVWSAISWRDYYETHRFVSALLVYFDQKLPYQEKK